ncbi:hypothetical protein Tco_0222114, partial [Tanacetum coccineum]
IHAFCKQDHENNHDDDSRPEGESNAKGKEHLRKSSTQEQQEEYDLWAEDQETYDDEVPSEEVTP